LQVPVKAEAGEEDYLEMVYRLLSTPAGEDDVDAEARPSLLEGAPLISLVLTIVHRPEAARAAMGAAPLPAVLRAYGAYGVPADLAFAPDDLPLLDRCGSGLDWDCWHAWMCLAAVLHVGASASIRRWQMIVYS
jgi:hypothetical protein